MAREGFLENSQINWNQLYTANSNTQNEGKAAYVLYDDTASDTQVSISTIANLKLNSAIHLDFGLSHLSMNSENYAQINDLLGADFHEDLDPFSNTQNDLNGSLNKIEDDKFNYHYKQWKELFIGIESFLDYWFIR